MTNFYEMGNGEFKIVQLPSNGKWLAMVKQEQRNAYPKWWGLSKDVVVQERWGIMFHGNVVSHFTEGQHNTAEEAEKEVATYLTMRNNYIKDVEAIQQAIA